MIPNYKQSCKKLQLHFGSMRSQEVQRSRCIFCQKLLHLQLNYRVDMDLYYSARTFECLECKYQLRFMLAQGQFILTTVLYGKLKAEPFYTSKALRISRIEPFQAFICCAYIWKTQPDLQTLLNKMTLFQNYEGLQ